MAYLCTGPLTDGDAPQTLRGHTSRGKKYHSQCGTSDQYEVNF